MDLAATRLSFQPAQSSSLASVVAQASAPNSLNGADQGLEMALEGRRPLLAAQTLADVIAFARQRDDLVRALTPDNLRGAASVGATAATIDSAPYPSGQHSAYDNVNGAFGETLATPQTRVALSKSSA